MRLSNSGVTAKPKRALSAAAVAGVAGLVLAPAAQADDDSALAAVATEVVGVDVTGSMTTEASSPKYTAPVLDTPQTITIVPSQVIRGQNLLSLRDILTTVPGITFGAGEGGGGYGDSINLRGYSANTDITVDGVRDSAQYSRSDTFNLEQLEVINGANSVFSGSGSVGGTINLVSKAPRGVDQTVLSGGVGTDDYWRGTVDADYLVSDSVAVRLNAMAHKNDVPGRDVDTNERWGVAPSVTLGFGGPTQLTVSYLHQEDNNTPQYGVPYVANALFVGTLPGVDTSDYFGYRNRDYQEQVIDSLTLKLTHAFSETLSVRNLTRWQQVRQDIVVNPPQGTYCLASGVNPQTGAGCGPPNTYIPSGPRGGRRDSKNTLLINQTDLTWRVATGGVNHTIVAGLAFTAEDYGLETGNAQRTPDGVAPTYPAMQLDDPDSLYAGPINPFRTGLSDGELRNRAVYVFDTIEITPQWELSGGLRYERNEGEFTSATIAAPSGVVTQNPVARNKDALVSYRVGLVYKPVPNASLYVSYANSRTPSQGTVNGGCSNTGTAQNCNLDPEKAEILEAGAKWDAMQGRLSLTGSIFRNERTNFRVASGDPLVPFQVLDGASRVNGVSLGASGLIGENWSVFANYTYLDSKILQSVANGVVDPVAGDPIPLTPKHAFSAWTTYELPFGLQLGYGVTFQGEVPFSRITSTAVPGYPGRYASDSYWVHSLAATWRATRAVEVQLNIKNLFDEDYFNRIRANNGFGWAMPGEARSAQVTVNYRF